MPALAPVQRLLLAPRPGRRRLATGVVLATLGGVLMLGALVALGSGGIAAFAPSDPATAQVGFTLDGDGSTRLVVAPVAARQVTTIEVFTSDPYGDGARPARPAWVARRAAAGTGDWARDLHLGETPAGFTVTFGTAVAPADVTAVMITNGCFGGPDLVPAAGSLRRGVVRADDTDLSTDEFLSDASGFTPCDDYQRTGRLGVVALGSGGAGAAAGTIGLVLIWSGRRVRHPRPGWYDDPAGEGLRWWDGTRWVGVALPAPAVRDGQGGWRTGRAAP